MKIEKRVFGQTKEGRDVLCWRIDDEKGMCAEILDYGVTNPFPHSSGWKK